MGALAIKVRPLWSSLSCFTWKRLTKVVFWQTAWWSMQRTPSWRSELESNVMKPANRVTASNSARQVSVVECGHSGKFPVDVCSKSFSKLVTVAEKFENTMQLDNGLCFLSGTPFATTVPQESNLHFEVQLRWNWRTEYGRFLGWCPFKCHRRRSPRCQGTDSELFSVWLRSVHSKSVRRWEAHCTFRTR